MTLPLTKKQEKLWRFIGSCERSPSHAEMAIEVYGNINAKGRVNDQVCALKERGFVDFIPGRARSIVALDPTARVSFVTTAELIAELTRRGLGVVTLPFRGRIS